ncbi:hypothetical protein PENSPDRAFT_690748 [Peniophora sp. CONT]|nr:hypothetical protein PENSPDRAFT_690748 [Peniophora sp. CONT]
MSASTRLTPSTAESAVFPRVCSPVASSSRSRSRPSGTSPSLGYERSRRASYVGSPEPTLHSVKRRTNGVCDQNVGSGEFGKTLRQERGDNSERAETVASSKVAVAREITDLTGNDDSESEESNHIAAVLTSLTAARQSITDLTGVDDSAEDDCIASGGASSTAEEREITDLTGIDDGDSEEDDRVEVVLARSQAAEKNITDLTGVDDSDSEEERVNPILRKREVPDRLNSKRAGGN